MFELNFGRRDSDGEFDGWEPEGEYRDRFAAHEAAKRLGAGTYYVGPVDGEWDEEIVIAANGQIVVTEIGS